MLPEARLLEISSSGPREEHRRPSWSALSPQEASCHLAVGGARPAAGGGAGQVLQTIRPHGGCWDIHSDTMGREGGSCQTQRHESFQPLSSAESMSPGMRAGGGDPWVGAERSLSLSPAHRLPQGCPDSLAVLGGAASDRSRQKSKTTFPEHTQPTARFLFPFRADARGVCQTQHAEGRL